MVGVGLTFGQEANSVLRSLLHPSDLSAAASTVRTTSMPVSGSRPAKEWPITPTSLHLLLSESRSEVFEVHASSTLVILLLAVYPCLPI